MAEVPEHLLKRSRERRKALGLPVEGDDGEPSRAAEPTRPRQKPARRAVEEVAAASRPTPAKRSPRQGRHPRAPPRAVAQAQGRARRRWRRRRAAAGGGGRAARTATAVAAPAPTSTGPGGHTQRLLTVVKSGSIQQTRAEAQDKVHVWPHLLALEFASILSLMAFITIFSALVKAPLLGLADVNQTPNPSKAPWYFLGLQELLKMFHPWSRE